MRAASPLHIATSSAEAVLTENRAATRSAAARAFAAPAAEGGWAILAAPRSHACPASSQPMVPSFRAATSFGIPALRSDWQPMMLRVRPAQFTTTSVSGSGARSCTR